jgi:uncharacterized protein
MATKIFVNLPVKDLERTKEFYGKLGYTFNPQFTNEDAASMIISEDIYAMLLTETFFKTFTKKEIVDATKSTEVLIALSADSREDVDKLVDTALAAGGTIPADPQDHGWMYTRSYQDPDGHVWEIVWMNPEAIQPQE